jgi:hypothetical protein
MRLLQFLKMTLEMTRELFGIMHTPDAKRMHVGEVEVLLSQSHQRKKRSQSRRAPLSLSCHRKRRSESRSPPPPLVAILPEEGKAIRTRGLVVTVNDQAPMMRALYRHW